MKLTHKEAVELIQEVYETAYNGTETFEQIGSQLAYVLGGIAMLAGDTPNTGVVFDPASDEDLAFIAMMEQWFPIEHPIWRHVNREIGE